MVIDKQFQKLNHRFTEINIEWLFCVVGLNLSGSFSAFEEKKLIRFAHFYPFEFSALDSQLETYYVFNMRSNTEFLDVTVVGYFAEKLVKTKKILFIHYFFFLIKLVLICQLRL